MIDLTCAWCNRTYQAQRKGAKPCCGSAECKRARSKAAKARSRRKKVEDEATAWKQPRQPRQTGKRVSAAAAEAGLIAEVRDGRDAAGDGFVTFGRDSDSGRETWSTHDYRDDWRLPKFLRAEPIPYSPNAAPGGRRIDALDAANRLGKRWRQWVEVRDDGPWLVKSWQDNRHPEYQILLRQCLEAEAQAQGRFSRYDWFKERGAEYFG